MMNKNFKGLLLNSFCMFAFLCFLNGKAQGYALDANGVNFSFLNANRITAPGPALGQVGSAAIYSNIATIQSRVLYGKITIDALVNTSVDTFDDDTGGADNQRFQPVYTTSAAGYVSYRLEFFDTVTNFPVYVKNFYFNGIDIDSQEQSGVSNTHLTEFYRLPNDEYSTVTVSNTTQLAISQIGAGTGSDTQIRGSGYNLSGLVFENTAAFYARYNDPKTSISFKIGANGAMANRQTAVKLGTNGIYTCPATTTNSPGPKVKNDLQIAKIVDIPTAPAGTLVEFTVTVKNNGPGAATNVQVGDLLPAGFTYSSKTVPAGTTFNESSGIWIIGNLGLNATRVLKIKATVKSTGVLKNEAGVTGNETESNTANNTASATVTLCAAPIITTQPATSQNLCKDAAVTTLSVAATGSGTLTYQWYSNAANNNTSGTLIAGAISSNYTPSSAAAGTVYYYATVTGTAPCGGTSSAPARVNVTGLATIYTQPLATQTVCQNTAPTNLSVTVTGTGAFTYQWYSNTANNNTTGTVIGGATSSTYTPPTNVVSTKYYYVVVSGTCNNVTSSIATVNVTGLTALTAQPLATQNKCQNSAATSLNITASGTGTLTYQWFNNGTNNSTTGGTAIAGATSSSYTPSTTTVGITYYYVIVTGSCDSIKSNVAKVNVSAATVINTQPLSTQTVTPGVSPSSITVIATGGTLSYQWYSNGSTNSNSGGSIISGATSASFTPPTTMIAGSYYYYAIVTGGCGNVTSNVSSVIVACTEQVKGEIFAAEGGAPKTFTQPPANNGFVFDVIKLDNSLSMTINGVNIATQEIQFQSAGTSGINARFADGTTYTPSGANGGTPEIYNMIGTTANPVLRIVINANGTVSLFGSKVSGGPLFPLELFNGAALNTVTWSSTANNVITISQTVVGPTYINGLGYGVNTISCICRKPGSGGTPDGYTKIGISTQKTKISTFPETVPNGFIALESTNKGLVITRTTTDKIADPKKGMIIYDTANNCVSLYNGTSWHCIKQSCND